MSKERVKVEAFESVNSRKLKRTGMDKESRRQRTMTTTMRMRIGTGGAPPQIQAQGSSSPTIATPCAACKLLRRRCAQECPFSPYFPPHDPQKFASVHKIFGASNVSKMLMEIPESQRADAANSLVYEANARIRDPVYGCLGLISGLQQQSHALQAELHAVRAEIIRYRSSCHHNALAAAAACMDVDVDVGYPAPSPSLSMQVSQPFKPSERATSSAISSQTTSDSADFTMVSHHPRPPPDNNKGGITTMAFSTAVAVSASVHNGASLSATILP